MIGLGLGQHAFFALFTAFLASTVLSMFLLMTRGRKGLRPTCLSARSSRSAPSSP